VVDSLGNAYLQQSVINSASAAETAAVRKRNKYSSFSGTHDFFPLALETLGPMSVSTQHPFLGTNRKTFDRSKD